jgi:GT2 family glycosyltransferase
MPRVAVHMVTYNSAAALPTCLQGLAAQRADFPSDDLAVLVVDNGSADDSVALARADGLPVIEARRNLGYAAAHNLALAQTESEYVLTLNPDVQLLPGFLRAMVAACEDAPQIGAAAGLLLRTEQPGAPPTAIDGCGLYMRRNRRQGLIAEGAPPDSAPHAIAPIFGPDGAAAFYRRAMLEAAGAANGGQVFDEDFWMHKEDVDLCWRALLLGWQAVYVPGAVAHHVRGFRPGQRGRVSPALRRVAARNRWLLLLKNELPGGLRRDWLPILAYEAAIFGYMLLRERASLGAYGEVWRLRSAMRAKRRQIMAQRAADWPTLRRWFV